MSEGGEGRRRADAQRNIDNILRAGLALYGRKSGVSMAEVAKEAGVGRVTLYGHFASRTDLAKALVDRALEETAAGMDALPSDDRPAVEVFERLLRTQWHTLIRNRRLRVNVLEDVSPQWLRQRHDPVLARVEKILARGQDEGAFRTDLPREWLLATLYSLVHGADDEVAEGRLTDAEAVEYLVTTLLSAFRTPGTGR